ncbi:hypothetical protein LCGC14_3053510, partial [marine sediment metagenome]
ARRLGLAVRAEEALLCADAYVGPVYRAWLFPEVARTVHELSEAGVYLGVISNTAMPAPVADRILSGAGLGRYFKVRIYSGPEGVAKPDPAIFHLARRRAGQQHWHQQRQ